MHESARTLAPARLLCGALLIGALSGGLPAAAQLTGNVDVDRWVAQDNLAPPQQGSILFAGSSSIRRWEDLTRDFADYNVIQRGFGGSQLFELNNYAEHIVLRHNPRAVVVWEGTNDLTFGRSSAQVFSDYQDFVNLVHTPQPEVDIFYVGVTPTPARPNDPNKNIALNDAIKNYSAGDSKLHYIDLPAAFDALNPPSDVAFTSKYVSDGIHLTVAGYDLWTSVIRPEIETVIAPNKVFTANPLTPVVGSKVLFDFGPNNGTNGQQTTSPDANGNHWNNWHSLTANAQQVIAGQHIANLVDTAGNATGINLTITGGFEATGGTPTGGLFSPQAALLGDLAIENATQDFFYLTADNLQAGNDDDKGGSLMLDGLNPNLLYDFHFLGSRTTTATRETEYRVVGANAGVDSLVTTGNNIGSDGAYDGNDDELAEILAIQPDKFGQVFIDLTVLQGQYGYLNAMEITATGAAVPEPASAALLLGTLSLLVLRRR